MGSVRSPLWRHGGTVHGPEPRDYSYKLPRKMQSGRAAIALSAKLRDGELRVVHEFPVAEPKTKQMRQALDAAGGSSGRCCWSKHGESQSGAREPQSGGREAGAQPARSTSTICWDTTGAADAGGGAETVGGARKMSERIRSDQTAAGDRKGHDQEGTSARCVSKSRRTPTRSRSSRRSKSCSR